MWNVVIWSNIGNLIFIYRITMKFLEISHKGKNCFKIPLVFSPCLQIVVAFDRIIVFGYIFDPYF